MDLAEFRFTARKFGVRAACYDALYRLGRRSLRWTVLRSMILTPETLDRSHTDCDPRYRCDFLTPDELRRFGKDPLLQLDAAFLAEALGRGDRCYGITDGAKLASYGWYSTRPTPSNRELMLHFDPSWVYMYKGYTARDYRGQRLHAVGMARAMLAHVELGLRGIVSQVESNNFSSLKSVYRMGYRDVGDIRACKTLGRWLIGADRSCDRYGLRLVSIRPAVSDLAKKAAQP